jgi:L-rhamnose mutarotase
LQRVCFLLEILPERLEEYKQRHAQVWPEMLAALSESGWHNYSLFLRADGLIVGYCETPDFQKAISEMKKHPVNDLWQRDMVPFLKSSDAGRADDQALRLEEIFHLD